MNCGVFLPDARNLLVFPRKIIPFGMSTSRDRILGSFSPTPRTDADGDAFSAATRGGCEPPRLVLSKPYLVMSAWDLKSPQLCPSPVEKMHFVDTDRAERWCPGKHRQGHFSSRLAESNATFFSFAGSAAPSGDENKSDIMKTLVLGGLFAGWYAFNIYFNM